MPDTTGASPEESPEVRAESAHDQASTPEELTRRSFMANATITLGGIVGLGLAIPIVGSLIPKTGAGTTAWTELDKVGWEQLQRSTDTPVQIQFVLSGKDAYLPQDEMPEAVWGVKVDPAKFAKLRPDIYDTPGGQVSYPALNMGFAIFSPICPHLGCRFIYDSGETKFVCRCHGSTYNRDGSHVAGPADRGLDPLPLRERGGLAEITWIRYAPTIPSRIVVSYAS